MPNTKEPVKNTCPIIDDAISTITDIVKTIDDLIYKNNEEELPLYLEGWSKDLYNIGVGNKCILEDLRTANSSLRSWGNEWVKEACHFEELLGEATTEIENLKEQIEELKNDNY